MSSSESAAPGKPGIAARWTSSVKSAVGTAAEARSRVWFTMSHGILNEVYYPRVDQANTRDLGLIVTSGSDFFSEEKRDTTSVVRMIRPGVPGYRVTNTCRDGHYRIVKTIVTDPERNAVLQRVHFDALQGNRADYRLYALLAPHIGNQGSNNNGWVGDYKGVQMMFAERDGCALAMACSEPFLAMSCGYVGASDGWQQLNKHKTLAECYAEARDGNIALTAQVDLEACSGDFVLVLAFGPSPAEAGQDARAGLLRHFDVACKEFVDGWERFHKRSRSPRTKDRAETDEYRLSAAVIRTHEDKGHPGGLIASLSIPWGDSKGDHDLGGYHVAWPRDLVESAGALLAAGHADGARHSLHYLMVTQDADGHWPQNMWLDGRPYWQGTQLDETAFPILLADHLRRRRALGTLRPWPMVRLAASYLVRFGPVTPEDRWEEDGGYSPFTLAVEIAALLAAADFADAAGQAEVARYLRETADVWYDSIDRWTYVTDTPLCRSSGVDGYYVRIAPRNVDDDVPAAARLVMIRNLPPGTDPVVYNQLVSPDALALVRFGLRSATDPRVVNTVRVIDRMLRTETPAGPVWHRYNGDGYGEHADGSAFDGTGVGRGWPLLAGERGHYELAAGDKDEARRLLGVMRAQASSGGLIPEQVWDAPDIPERNLIKGCPSGSAMPLVWAHAEYLKLARSLEMGRIFDMPPQTVKRYGRGQTACNFAMWRFNHKIRSMAPGRILRIEAQARFVIHWTCGDRGPTQECDGVDTTIGVWVADLATKLLPPGSEVRFTFFWPDADRWEGTSFSVCVGAT